MAGMDMGPKSSPTVSSETTVSASPPPDLHRPLPLSAAQESQVKDIYYSRVRGHCAKEIKDFAECARGRTISATWICRSQRLSMNSCMISHATKAEEDDARAEWFSSRLERRKKREEEAAALERRRQEVITLIKRQEDKERAAEGTAVQPDTEPKTKKGWW